MTKSYFPVIIEKDADGYFARCPQLQGCYSQGETYDEAMANIRDAIRLHIEDRLACGEPLPELEGVTTGAVEIAYEPALAQGFGGRSGKGSGGSRVPPGATERKPSHLSQ